jgi:hypothetical protein
MQNATVRDRGKTRNGAERDRRTLSELRDQCRNVGATSLLDLDLHPNVAGIGTLQRYIYSIRATLVVQFSMGCSRKWSILTVTGPYFGCLSQPR